PVAAETPLRAGACSLVLQELNEDRAIDDDMVDGFEALADVVAVAGSVAQGDVAACETAVGQCQIDKRQVLVVAQNCRYGDQQSAAFPASLDLNPDIHLLPQEIAGIVDNHAH